MPEVRVCKKGEIADGHTRLVKAGPVATVTVLPPGDAFAAIESCAVRLVASVTTTSFTVMSEPNWTCVVS